MDTDGIESKRPLTSRRGLVMLILLVAALLVPGRAGADPGADRPASSGGATSGGTTSEWATSGQGLRVTAVDPIDERLTQVSVTTSALARPVRLDILLPTGYDTTTRRYPVLYLLHGTSGGAPDWTTTGNAREATVDLPLIVVMPDGGYDSNGGGWWTDWVDQGTSLGKADWETFHIDQMIPWIDAHLRTIRARSGRAIAGLSQGGFGSFSYAARHPDLFVAAASFSGAPDIAEAPAAKVLGPMVVGGIMMGLNQVQPNAPFGDPVTDAINWRGHNPASLVINLRGMDLRLWSGNGVPAPEDLSDSSAPPAPDPIEAAVHESSTLFAQAADAAKVPYVFDDYGPGLHHWRYWNRDLVQYLPHLMKIFAAHRSVPRVVSYRSIDARYAQWGWQVRVRRTSGPAFTGISAASPRGFVYTGASPALVTTPAVLRNGRHRLVVGTTSRTVVVTGHRLRIAVPAGTTRVRIL